MDPDIGVHNEDERGDGVEKVMEEIDFLQQISGHGIGLCALERTGSESTALQYSNRRIFASTTSSARVTRRLLLPGIFSRLQMYRE
jgi:hypothetical protein